MSSLISGVRGQVRWPARFRMEVTVDAFLGAIYERSIEFPCGGAGFDNRPIPPRLRGETAGDLGPAVRVAGSSAPEPVHRPMGIEASR